MSKSVMCIDDSSTIRMLVKKALEPEGYRVWEAENGEEGLKMSEGKDVSAFIVDVNMPVMDGFEFVRNIKKNAQAAGTPIVFLTTESSAQKKQIGKELGVNGWIVKPFDAPSLVKIINMLTG